MNSPRPISHETIASILANDDDAMGAFNLAYDAVSGSIDAGALRACYSACRLAIKNGQIDASHTATLLDYAAGLIPTAKDHLHALQYVECIRLLADDTHSLVSSATYLDNLLHRSMVAGQVDVWVAIFSFRILQSITDNRAQSPLL